MTARDPDDLSGARAMGVTTTTSAGPQIDREVLQTFYGAAGGESWTNRASWRTSAPLHEWYGVTTDADGRVTALILDDNGLAGSIPPALASLSDLEHLRLGSNALGGPIPPELGDLSSLRSLLLGGNELVGPIPDALGRLTDLEWLHLWSNALSGPIPAELGNLRNVRGLYLDRNELTGSIPTELRNLADLVYLGLPGNALTGAVPAWLGDLENLRILALGSNALTGRIPAALGRLSNLERLTLGGNDLTGPIPDALGRLSNLESLALDRTALTGPIPEALGNLTNLRRLDLFYAWGLTGPLPRGLHLSRLEELDIFVSRTCAPAVWQDWLETIEFNGRLCEVETDVTIDVAVVYTPAARMEAGGAAEIAAVIDLMLAETNQAYAESGVGHRLALVARSEVSYTEAGDFRNIDRLMNPSDGYMDEVHAMRDRTGADLVHLVFKRRPDHLFGGVGRRARPFGLTCVQCGGRVFAHELGHNMGLRHDRYQQLYGRFRNEPLTPDPAFGYVNQRAVAAGAARSSRWRTIMAYNTECADVYTECSWLLRFSNSRQSHHGDPLGVPFGVGGSGVTGPADAAAVLNATGPAVALWRDHVARPNRPPVAAGTLPDRRLTPRDVLDVDVSQAFVDPDGDPLTYAVSSSAPHVVTVAAAGARVTLTAVSAGTATIRVTATDPGGLTVTRSFAATVAAPAPFTDHPIVPGETRVRAVHFAELRTRIDGVRTTAGLGRFAWTDPVLRAGVTRVRLVHLLELRSALAAAYAAAGRPAPRWPDAAAAGGATPIRAAHVMELRAAVVALE